MSQNASQCIFDRPCHFWHRLRKCQPRGSLPGTRFFTKNCAEYWHQKKPTSGLNTQKNIAINMNIPIKGTCNSKINRTERNCVCYHLWWQLQPIDPGRHALTSTTNQVPDERSAMTVWAMICRYCRPWSFMQLALQRWKNIMRIEQRERFEGNLEVIKENSKQMWAYCKTVRNTIAHWNCPQVFSTNMNSRDPCSQIWFNQLHDDFIKAEGLRPCLRKSVVYVARGFGKINVDNIKFIVIVHHTRHRFPEDQPFGETNTAR